MTKRLLTIVAVFIAISANAQKDVSSPYSYFGIGLPSFNGAAESRSMAGLSVLADSLHFGFQNPAEFGELKYTTFTIGVTQNLTKIKSQTKSGKNKNTSFDYLALGLPAGKFGFGFGVIPYSAVGYKIEELTATSLSRFSGRGGLNRVFLSVGFKIKKGFRLGIEGTYNFGNVQNKNLFFQDDIQYGTREKNRSNLSGFKFKLGAQYETAINKKLTLKTSATFSPASSLNSQNIRKLATVVQSSSGAVILVNEQEVSLPETSFDLPSDFRLGVGIGENHKWFVGAEFENIGKTDYKNTSFSLQNVGFTKSTIYRLGGYYIPSYADITNYFKRITLRAGFRYQELGMRINGHDINEYAFSFGLGLPIGHYSSNVNFGVEYGVRGTTSANLVQENFVNIFVGISFNDLWFIQRKYH